MTAITDNFVVEINYNLTTSDGELLDSSKDQGPLYYIHGKKNIIPGLEKGLDGKKVGDEFKVVVAPEEAYGEFDEQLVKVFKKEQFGESANDLRPGMQFEIETDEGQVLIMAVIELKEDEVVLDGNHPLAGETLHFDVEVLSLRMATDKELEQGFIETNSKCCDDKGCC